MEKKPGDHGMREARQQAVRGEPEIATVPASWKLKPKTEYSVVPPHLKQEPALATEEARLAAIEQALQTAVAHMHASEERKSPPVVGMKTYSIAIMTEALGLAPADIEQDEGALSDLAEYLTDMIRVTKFTDMRSPDFDPSAITDPEVQLVHSIRATWELPNNEFQFGGPNMYQRVDWVRTNPAEGN